jgi:hypothetical protein
MLLSALVVPLMLLSCRSRSRLSLAAHGALVWSALVALGSWSALSPSSALARSRGSWSALGSWSARAALTQRSCGARVVPLSARSLSWSALVPLVPLVALSWLVVPLSRLSARVLALALSRAALGSCGAARGSCRSRLSPSLVWRSWRSLVGSKN